MIKPTRIDSREGEANALSHQFTVTYVQIRNLLNDDWEIDEIRDALWLGRIIQSPDMKNFKDSKKNELDNVLSLYANEKYQDALNIVFIVIDDLKSAMGKEWEYSWKNIQMILLTILWSKFRDLKKTLKYIIELWDYPKFLEQAHENRGVEDLIRNFNVSNIPSEST